MRTVGEAMRAMKATANDPQSNICRHPADFTMFEIGEYDDSTGKIKSHSAFINLGLGVEFKDKPASEMTLPMGAPKKVQPAAQATA